MTFFTRRLYFKKITEVIFGYFLFFLWRQKMSIDDYDYDDEFDDDEEKDFDYDEDNDDDWY